MSFGSCHCEILRHSFASIARLSDQLAINGPMPSTRMNRVLSPLIVEREGGSLAVGVGGAGPSILVVVPVGHGVAVGIGNADGVSVGVNQFV